MTVGTGDLKGMTGLRYRPTVSRNINFLIPLLALVAAGVATAQTRGGAPEAVVDDVRLYRETHAIIIGIDAYSNLGPQYQLSYAVDDARAVAAVLEEHYRFASIQVLLDEDATRDGILDAFSNASDELTEDDGLFIFWAGHGYTEETRRGELGYLIPTDGSFEPEDMWKRNISMQMLRDEVARRVPAKHVFLVVDACYGGLLTETRALPTRLEHSADYLRQVTSEDAFQVLTAGARDQEVLDGGANGHSLFTGRLLEALVGPEDYVTARDLGTWIPDRVYTDAKVRGHEQTPSFGRLWGNGDFVFVPLKTLVAAEPEPEPEAEVAVRGGPAAAPAGDPSVYGSAADVMLEEAWNAYDGGVPEVATSLARSAMRLNPMLYETILVRALATEALGEPRRARALLQQYGDLEPTAVDDPRVVEALARVEASLTAPPESQASPTEGPPPVTDELAVTSTEEPEPEPVTEEPEPEPDEPEVASVDEPEPDEPEVASVDEPETSSNEGPEPAADEPAADESGDESSATQPPPPETAESGPRELLEVPWFADLESAFMATGGEAIAYDVISLNNSVPAGKALTTGLDVAGGFHAAFRVSGAGTSHDGELLLPQLGLRVGLFSRKASLQVPGGRAENVFPERYIEDTLGAEVLVEVWFDGQLAAARIEELEFGPLAVVTKSQDWSKWVFDMDRASIRDLVVQRWEGDLTLGDPPPEGWLPSSVAAGPELPREERRMRLPEVNMGSQGSVTASLTEMIAPPPQPFQWSSKLVCSEALGGVEFVSARGGLAVRVSRSGLVVRGRTTFIIDLDDWPCGPMRDGLADIAMAWDGTRLTVTVGATQLGPFYVVLADGRPDASPWELRLLGKSTRLVDFQLFGRAASE